MPSYGGMKYPFQFVVHEILALENKGEKTQIKKAAAFKRDELAGFWKKHFYVPSYHLGENARLALGLDKKDTSKFASLISCASKAMGYTALLSDVEKQVFAKELSEQCMKQVLERRKHAENTGDYLVFVPHNGKNYCLCIAKHSQDSFVRDCIEKCMPQFPFLREPLGK
jgi:hypothetical protein